MYLAYNKNVIAAQVTESVVTSSGIITTSTKVPRYLIIKTTEETKDLLNKTVLAERVLALDSQFYAISYEDIIAVVE